MNIKTLMDGSERFAHLVNYNQSKYTNKQVLKLKLTILLWPQGVAYRGSQKPTMKKIKFDRRVRT